MIQNCKVCSTKNIKVVEDTVNVGLCGKCSVNVIAYNRYYETNIPIEYWTFKMPSSIEQVDDFKGPKKLLEVYFDSIKDLNKFYIDGLSFCLAGMHGVGKTTLCANILKKVSQKNFTALFTNLSDIVNALTVAPAEDKYFARKELIEVDFLVIDEFDTRHIGNTENANDLFGRTLEYVIRGRLQNKLPIILVSNSPNPTETFSGSIKQSVNSLMNKIPLIPIIGSDNRKRDFKKLEELLNTLPKETLTTLSSEDMPPFFRK